MNKTEKTLMRAGLLIGLAMLGSVSAADAGNVQDQADCARVAQKDFDVAKASPPGKFFSRFESHYNTKMHACLVLRHHDYYDEEQPTVNESLLTLVDIGGHAYANYGEHQQPTNNFVAYCSFEPAPYAERKYCNSLSEFMASIKPYM